MYKFAVPQGNIIALYHYINPTTTNNHKSSDVHITST